MKKAMLLVSFLLLGCNNEKSNIKYDNVENIIIDIKPFQQIKLKGLDTTLVCSLLGEARKDIMNKLFENIFIDGYSKPINQIKIDDIENIKLENTLLNNNGLDYEFINKNGIKFKLSFSNDSKYLILYEKYYPVNEYDILLKKYTYEYGEPIYKNSINGIYIDTWDLQEGNIFNINKNYQYTIVQYQLTGNLYSKETVNKIFDKAVELKNSYYKDNKNILPQAINMLIQERPEDIENKKQTKILLEELEKAK